MRLDTRQDVVWDSEGTKSHDRKGTFGGCKEIRMRLQMEIETRGRKIDVLYSITSIGRLLRPIITQFVCLKTDLSLPRCFRRVRCLRVLT